jgi:hypothetical protein
VLKTGNRKSQRLISTPTYISELAVSVINDDLLYTIAITTKKGRPLLIFDCVKVKHGKGKGKFVPVLN